MAGILSFDWDSVIPPGLGASYATANDLINALNALDINLIPQMYDFTMSLTHKYNRRGALRIGWNCQAKNVVFSGRDNLRLLTEVLNLLNHKAKVMLLVATLYQDQKSKALNRPRICCFQFIFQNTQLFNHYWTNP